MSEAELQELRIIYVAPLADCYRLPLRAVARQDQLQLGQPHVAVLLDQPVQSQPAAALTAAARDVQHCDPANQVAERDRIASHSARRASAARACSISKASY